MKLSAAQRNQITPFRAKVFDALLQVPEGKVTTYKQLADKIDCKSSQAIGQALRHNPFAPQVPCHRVVKSDRSIGGFGGFTKGEKIDKKIQLLQDEGVFFVLDDDTRKRLVDESCLYKF